jgi:hypothetical protein
VYLTLKAALNAFLESHSRPPAGDPEAEDAHGDSSGDESPQQ